MSISVEKVALEKIQGLREQFLHESRFQFICNKCHDYGWADTYILKHDHKTAGYASIWGTDHREDRDTIFEFFLTKPFRDAAPLFFHPLTQLPGVKYIEAQSNDILLSYMLYEYSTHVVPEAILFEENYATHLGPSDHLLRSFQSGDGLGEHGDLVLEVSGRVVASGGLMLNYNFPYADIYMQVKEDARRQGFGSLMVQELKKEAYRIGRVPAARCNVANKASRSTLLKAGLRICGYRLKGELKSPS